MDERDRLFGVNPFPVKIGQNDNEGRDGHDWQKHHQWTMNNEPDLQTEYFAVGENVLVVS